MNYQVSIYNFYELIYFIAFLKYLYFVLKKFHLNSSHLKTHLIVETIDDTVYLSICVKPKFYVHILLAVAVVIAITPFLFNGFKTADSIMTSLTFMIFWILFPLKYAWWNVFGKEMLIINRKSISYQYHYGFIKNNLKTVTYQNLSVRFQTFLIDKEKKLGKMYFYEESEKTGLPNLLHNTSIYILQSEYDIVIEEIKLLFLRYHTFSMN